MQNKLDQVGEKKSSVMYYLNFLSFKMSIYTGNKHAQINILI